MDLHLVGVLESSCPCRNNYWDPESCPEPRFQSLFASMPGPSTGHNSDDLQTVIKDCSVALQRLEDMLPNFQYATRSANTPAGKERRLRALAYANGTAEVPTDDWIRDHVHRQLWRSRNEKRLVVMSRLGYTVTSKDLKTVLGTNWLNDVIIDFYLGLVAERAGQTPDGLRVHALTAHFFNVLRNRGYDAVRRWTDSLDLFAVDLVLVPIHDSDHWSLAVLNISNRSFDFYDSMGRKNWNCYQTLMAYLRKEHKDKRNLPLSPSSKWECRFMKGIPVQGNSHDCGVFVCLYAECLARGAPFNFSAKDIQRLRYIIAYEIMSGKLMDHQS